jgi:hypothetical protein
MSTIGWLVCVGGAYLLGRHRASRENYQSFTNFFKAFTGSSPASEGATRPSPGGYQPRSAFSNAVHVPRRPLDPPRKV